MLDQCALCSKTWLCVHCPTKRWQQLLTLSSSWGSELQIPRTASVNTTEFQKANRLTTLISDACQKSCISCSTPAFLSHQRLVVGLALHVQVSTCINTKPSCHTKSDAMMHVNYLRDACYYQKQDMAGNATWSKEHSVASQLNSDTIGGWAQTANQRAYCLCDSLQSGMHDPHHHTQRAQSCRRCHSLSF